MINEECIEKLINISKKGIVFNLNDLRLMIDLIISDEDTITQNNYNGLVEDHGKTAYARYNNDTKLLHFNLNRLKNDVLDNRNIAFTNLSILQVLLHEIEHVKEKSKIMNGSPIEATLLKNSDKQYLIERLSEQQMLNELNFRRTYRKNAGLFSIREDIYLDCFNKIMELNKKKHYLFPSERMADINSLNILYNSLVNNANFCKNFYSTINVICDAYMIALMEGYKFTDSDNYSKIRNAGNIAYQLDVLDPLTEYCNELNIYTVSEDLTPFLDNYEDYSLADRLRYGLPILEEEIRRDKIIKKTKDF